MEADNEEGAFYECDYEAPCQCHESGVEGSWEWSEADHSWKCSGCNDLQ